MKCKEIMVGDWISDIHGLQITITEAGRTYAYGYVKGDPLFGYDFDDENEPPVPIPLTYEILKKNGWKDAEFWCEYQDGNNAIQSCLPDMRGRINGIEIEHFKCEYVHQYQHLLRLCGLDELAENFEI